MRFILENNRGVVPCAIKWQTRSNRSHAILVFGDDTMIEATWPKVRVNPWAFPDYRWTGLNYDVYGVATTLEQEKQIREFAEKQIGKPYDLTMVIRFVTREQETRKSKGAWFCSELVFAAFRSAGINLLERIEPWAVSPALLEISPLATLIATVNPKE